MSHVKQIFNITAPTRRVWRALTDASIIEQWGAGPAKMDARVGGEFSLWDGGVHGTTTEIVPEKLLRQDWYGDDNPDRKYDVTFSFDFDDYRGDTVVTVEHEASDDDQQSMSDGWREYYFEPIKKLLEKPKDLTGGMMLELAEKEHLIGNIWAFRFRPTGQLSWKGGQYIYVDLPHDNPDDGGTDRWFSVSSAPYEGLLQITTRVSDSTFKQALAALPVGGQIRLLIKPEGDFVWQDSDLPLILVAGGIGVTPYHAILKQRVHDKLPLSATLIYGGRDDELPFKDEFKEMAANDPHFKVKYVIGEPLTAEKLAELEADLNKSLVYLSGPEPMVDKLMGDLIKQGLPQSQIRKDPFLRYTQANY